MLIWRDKRQYAVITFQRMMDLLAKTPVSTRKATILINDSKGHTPLLT